MDVPQLDGSSSLIKEKIKFMTELEGLENKISGIKVETAEAFKLEEVLQVSKSKIMHSLL